MLPRCLMMPRRVLVPRRVLPNRRVLPRCVMQPRRVRLFFFETADATIADREPPEREVNLASMSQSLSIFHSPPLLRDH